MGFYFRSSYKWLRKKRTKKREERKKWKAWESLLKYKYYVYCVILYIRLCAGCVQYWLLVWYGAPFAHSSQHGGCWRLSDFSIHEICCDVSRAFRPSNIFSAWCESTSTGVYISTISRRSLSSPISFFYSPTFRRMKERNGVTCSYAYQIHTFRRVIFSVVTGSQIFIMHKMKGEEKNNNNYMHEMMERTPRPFGSGLRWGISVLFSN